MKKFLHIFIFALMLTILFCIGISAAEWTDADGRTWTFDTSTETIGESEINIAIISGAKLKDGEARTSELNIPSEVYIDTTKYTVTKIKAGAFSCIDNKSKPDDIGENTKSGDTFLKKVYFGHVTIPNTVTEIGERAFEYSAIYGTVVIPDSVTTIGKRAFRGCVGLDTVIYSANCSKVPENCFEGSKALVEFKARGKIDTISKNAFSDCQALLYAYYAPMVPNPEKQSEMIEGTLEPLFAYTKTLGDNAFKNTSISGELDLSSLESLGGNAFYNCNFLTKVILGKCAFVRSAFSYDDGKVSTLKEVVISEENEKFCSDNGIVFNKDKTEIIFYSPAKYDQEYTIPNTVITIKDSCFYRAKFKKVIIPSSVTKIENNAFKRSEIESLYVPSTVKTVGSTIVQHCPNVLWVVFDSGITTLPTNAVDTGSCAVLKSRAFAKNGISISGGLTYIPNTSCLDIVEIGAHFYGYIDNEPTCDTAGTYKCCLCYEETPAKALGHKGKIVATSKLTCTTPESFTVECYVCGETSENIITPYVGHTLSAPKTVTETKYQYSYSVCTTCKCVVVDSFTTDTYDSGDINDDGSINDTDVLLLGKILAGGAVGANTFACDINADGSITVADLMLLKQYVKNGTNTIKENNGSCAKHVRVKTIVVQRENCTDGGAYVYFCAECGEIIMQGENNDQIALTVSLKGHLFTDTTITAATCSTEGKMKRVCTVCQHTEEAPIPTLEHQFTWWMLGDDDLEFQYGYCSICRVLGHQEVNRGVLDEVAAAIPTDFEIYCTAESRSVLRPIVANSKKALTQEQVDLCIQEIRRVLPTIQYKVNDIPIVYLDSRGSLTKSYSSATVIVSYMEDGQLKSITDSEAEIKIRGNATSNVTAKLPFNIKFSREVDLFGMGASKKYILLANALDTSTIRNAVAFTFAQNLGLDYTCQFRFVEVYQDGKYNGCYNLCTAIEIGEDRVDIDEEKDVIIHLSYKNGSEDAAFPSPIFGLRLMRLEEPSEYTPYTKSQMIRIMHQADFAILSGDIDEMAEVMDMDSMIKYFVFHEYVKDMDMVWDSTRFYVEDGKLHGGPCWDLDISQGNVSNKFGHEKSTVTGFDEYSGYHYWNQHDIYSDIVSKSELEALGKLSSAIGPWADALWVNDRNGGTSNPNLNNGQRRWWYSYMLEYSEDFRVEVAKFIKENETLFKAIYESVTDPETGKTTDCIIDAHAFGEAGEAIIRNYTAADAPFGSSYNPNGLTYGEDDTHQASVEYLKAWWKTRCEWLYDYYTTNFLPKN